MSILWLTMIVGEPADRLFPDVVIEQTADVEDVNALVGLTREGGGNSQYYTPLWGTDQLVREGYSVLSDMAMDVDENGNIYVAILLDHPQPAENDTVEIWMSDDGGLNWTHLYSLYEAGSNGGIYELDMVVDTGADPVIYTFLLYDNQGPDDDEGIWLNMGRPSSGPFNWIRLTADSTQEMLSASINSSGEIMVGYRQEGTKIYVQFSTDGGFTWDTSYVSLGNRSWPSVHLTDDHMGLVAYTVDDTVLRIGIYDNFASPQFYTLYPTCDGLRHLSITGGNGNYVVVWSNYHASTDVWDVHYAYSTDGGSTWTNTVFPPTNFAFGSRDAVYPSVNYSGSFRFVTTLINAPFDSIYYSFSSTPDGWGDLDYTVVNDYNGTTVFGAEVARTPYTAGGIVVYREYGSGNIWIDGYNYTSSRETISENLLQVKVSGKVLHIITRNGQPVSIGIYTVSGKKIGSSVINGRGSLQVPSSGMYILKATAEKETYTKSIMVY